MTPKRTWAGGAEICLSSTPAPFQSGFIPYRAWAYGKRFGVRHECRNRGRGLMVEWGIERRRPGGTGNGVTHRAVGRF